MDLNQMNQPSFLAFMRHANLEKIRNQPIKKFKMGSQSLLNPIQYHEIENLYGFHVWYIFVK